MSLTVGGSVTLTLSLSLSANPPLGQPFHEVCVEYRNSVKVAETATAEPGCRAMFFSVFVRPRRGGDGPGLFDPPSSPTTAGRTHARASPSHLVPERQQRQRKHQHQHQQQQQHKQQQQQQQQQRATPMYLAPTASSRHKHKRRSTNLKSEAKQPAKTEVS